MRSTELAASAGVNPQTLRYYERRGLLAAPPRSAAGYRAYPAEAVRVVRFVKRAQELGFSLDDPFSGTPTRHRVELPAGRRCGRCAPSTPWASRG